MRASGNPLGRGWLWLSVAVLLAVLGWGLEQIAFAPLQTGEAYPPFSSLRSDPQGAMGLYESLAGLAGIRVERLYKQRDKLDGAGDTMLVLGLDPEEWSKVDDDALVEYEKLVENGGRLVIAFLPVSTYWKDPQKMRPAQARWHVNLMARPGGDATSSGMPRKTELYFETRFFPDLTTAGTGWRAIAFDPSDHLAEAIERTFGKGTIVLAADTFPLSNEGLREARNPEQIAKLIGPAHRIIFDETHFGVVETGSVTQLMRRYRLQGAIAILIVVAALFLWRSASSLLPPRESGDPDGRAASGAAQDAVAGRDSLEGLTALLHRGVSKKELLDTCFSEWMKSAPRQSRAGLAADRLRIDGVAERVKQELARAANPVDAYRAACRILTEKT